MRVLGARITCTVFQKNVFANCCENANFPRTHMQNFAHSFAIWMVPHRGRIKCCLLSIRTRLRQWQTKRVFPISGRNFSNPTKFRGLKLIQFLCERSPREIAASPEQLLASCLVQHFGEVLSLGSIIFTGVVTKDLHKNSVCAVLAGLRQFSIPSHLSANSLRNLIIS